VPELRDEAKKRNLDHGGKRKQLLMRLSLWVRDELAAVGGGQLEAEAAVNDDSQQEPVAQDDDESSSDGDDSSVSSEELEVCHATEEVGKDVSIEKSSSNQKCNEEAKDEPPKETSQGETTPLTLEEQLQNLFGHEEFREGQEWAVRRCLEKQRTLLVAPTGFGKSLCYALPAALLDGVCIVVSPLISLMQDQLRQLPPRIPAATLSGSLTAAAMAATIDDVIRNRLKILFVSPERLTSPSFQRLFQTRWNHETKTRERSFPKVSLLCVDEAHCVSQWAHNFRPSYLRLKSMLELMQPESVLAMTATAGPRVVKDICDALYIPHCEDSAGETQGEQGEDDIVGGHGVKILAYDRDNIDVCCRVFSNEGERLSMVRLFGASTLAVF
jgi:superfamily II DNA helicase RecQ